jgi:D-alanyl-D-alanine dipeptidase
MQLRVRASALIVAGGLLLCLTATSFAQALPGDFVYLRDIDPSILQDIRYATTNNFTGRKLAGYEAGECVVRRDVASALSRVQQELKPRGLSLKMLDCYRPARASRAMLAWSREAAETAASRRYYPRANKRELFALGYIAAYSGHSTGAAVDLTLVDLSVEKSGAFDPSASYADCTAPADQRAPEGSVDMGTGYDCFDAASHTRAAQVTPEQRKWRQTLIAAMTKQGFANYFREWWHFSLPVAGRSAFDFPISRSKGAQ